MIVEEMINKVRFKVNDVNEVKFSNFDVLDKINEANRFFRKICYEEAPDLLAIVKCGVLEEGHNHVHLCAMPIKVVDAFCHGRHLDPSNDRSVLHMARQGVPTVYVVQARCSTPSLALYPIPSQDVEYSVKYIPETTELDAESELLLPTECIYYYIDFVATKLLGGDPQAFMELDDKLRSMLRNYTPSPCVVDSYY